MSGYQTFKQQDVGGKTSLVILFRIWDKRVLIPTSFAYSQQFSSLVTVPSTQPFSKHYRQINKQNKQNRISFTACFSIFWRRYQIFCFEWPENELLLIRSILEEFLKFPSNFNFQLLVLIIYFSFTCRKQKLC